MDIVRLASPWILLLALPAWAAILYASLGVRFGLGRDAGSFRPRRSTRQGAVGRAALACLASALLIAAVAGPRLRVSRQGVAPVCIVEDVSASMACAARPPAEELARWSAALPRGQAGLARFAGGAAVVAAPFSREADALASPRAATSAGGPTAVGRTDETDIAAGLETAASALPGGQGVLLLYSDGRETRPGAVAAAGRLAARDIRVFAVAPDLHPRHARIISIASRSQPAPGRPVTLQVAVTSTVAADVQVVLTRQAADGAEGARWQRTVPLDGRTAAVLLFEDAALPEGLYAYEAQVTLAQDAWPQYSGARFMLRVGTPRRTLYVFGSKGPGPLPPILRRHLPPGTVLNGKPVNVVTPAAVADASVIILDNIPAWTLGAEMAGLLSRAVTDGGAGLLALGGDASFAAGGYGDSPLESTLPVTSRTAERPPLAMVIVVDSSGSMNEKVGEVQKLALAKQAVLALRPALAGGDRLGIVAFAADARVLSPLAPLTQWDDLRAKLLALQAGGGTRITPAALAAMGLFPARAPGDRTVRHVLLLSDGRSADFDIDRLVADSKSRAITVSVVATGPDADRDRLGRLAAGAAGRLYATGDLGRLTEAFLEDLAWARGEGLRDGPAQASWRDPQPIWPRAGPALPPVPAWNATKAKQGADVLWTATVAAPAEAPPLLACWQRGLGKAAAMPWPVAGASGPWLSDDTVGRYLTSVMAWLSAAPVPTDWSASLVERGGTWQVRVEQRPEAIDKSAVPFVAVPLGGAADAAGVVIPQVAPGIYEAATGTRTGEAAVIAVHRQDNAGGAIHLAAVGLPPLEFEHVGVDAVRLEEIVRAGGGQVLTAPAALADVVRQRETHGYEAVGIYLVWAAGAAVVAMVALRLAGRL
jgi:Mg-chelatase subunit ChlD